MNFVDAVRSVFTQYVGFSGRARRSEYWWFTLFTVLIAVVGGVVDAGLQTPVLIVVVELALFLPSLAVTVRRLHDTGRSGWWFLIDIVPLIGTIVMLVFLCQDSDPGQNRWGSSPKYSGGPKGGPYPQSYPGPA